LAKTSAKVKPIRSSNVSLVFHLPMDERASGGQPFGEKLSREQERCNQIAHETNTSIELSESKDGTLTVVLNGKREQTEEARRRVVVLLQQQASRELSIPKEFHRGLVGKEGRRLRELEEETDCHIVVPGRDQQSNIIKITGPRDGIEKAAHKIIMFSESQAKMATESVVIEREYWPWIRGANNEIVETMQSQYNVRVNIPPTSANNSVIVVSGEKEGVAKAAAQLKAIHEKAKAKLKVMTVEIPKAQHRYVIGPHGSGIQDILKQTNVSVEVPPEDVDSATITLRGDPVNLAAALPMVYQKATSIITITVPCPVWLHRWIIGVKGAGIRQIQGERQRCQIDFDENGTIIVHGPPEEVGPVEAQLSEMAKKMMKEMDSKVVKVAPQHHRHIIGKQGGVVNKMKTEYNVQISIPENSTNSDEIRIEGPKEGVAKAVKEITELASRIENERSKDIIIEQRFHRQIIGQGGSAVADLRAKFPGVSLTFPEQGRKSDIVTIR
jgi:rRNA processing protein Krr1/Pno1